MRVNIDIVSLIDGCKNSEEKKNVFEKIFFQRQKKAFKKLIF